MRTPLIALVLVLTSCSGPEAEAPETAPDASVELQLEAHVRKADGGEWTRQLRARPGDTLQFRIALVNRGSDSARRVVVIERLPRGLRALAAGAVVNTHGASVPPQDPVRSGLLGEGLDVGELPPFQPLSVEFEARVRKTAAGRQMRSVVTAGSARDVASDSVVITAEA